MSLAWSEWVILQELPDFSPHSSPSKFTEEELKVLPSHQFVLVLQRPCLSRSLSGLRDKPNVCFFITNLVNDFVFFVMKVFVLVPKRWN